MDYEGDDIEEMFMQTFRICYKDAFGEIVYHDRSEYFDCENSKCDYRLSPTGNGLRLSNFRVKTKLFIDFAHDLSLKVS